MAGPGHAGPAYHHQPAMDTRAGSRHNRALGSMRNSVVAPDSVLLEPGLLGWTVWKFRPVTTRETPEHRSSNFVSLCISGEK